ncbi:MAG: hypothetical protein NZ959_08390 [Armatimonadetes bacterium]|nr:hypothetical protein [Armatimonadota bacterium]MDW8122461.1 hypothetical protein [Armatimonadota bacterium]
MGERSCRVEPVLIDGRHLLKKVDQHPAADRLLQTRRSFLRKAMATAATLTAADFLSFFFEFGPPKLSSRVAAAAKEAAAQTDRPHFLIYWFLEGGWISYDMFSPVDTPNNVLHRLANISEERYRVIKWKEDPFYRIFDDGRVRYGFLVKPGEHLLKDMAIVSSMYTGTFHSGERLKAHMGEYNLRITEERQEDERSVTQAFCEVYGQSYPLANISWHNWLSDGELNEAQFTGRRGYYHALGPVWAHTIYAGTPHNLRQFLLKLHASTEDATNKAVQSFLDDASSLVFKDSHIETVRSYQSALEIYKKLMATGSRLNQSLISRLFTDPVLREKFQITPEDELITYTSVNGNKARTKYSPMTNVQAMMTWELMRHGLSCAFWIESRDIRLFDSHRSRRALWDSAGRPVGMTDQTEMIRRNLWAPLSTLVELLKTTEYGNTGTSYFDHTVIVITSEFGRTIHGDVDAILKMNIPEEEKKRMVDEQDICQHWPVTSCAFLGGKVNGWTQFGGVGEKTLMPIPILPDGRLDPAYDPVTGELKPGHSQNPQSFIPNHGHIYATALYLSDIDPKGKGRNTAPPLTFIKRPGLS